MRNRSLLQGLCTPFSALVVFLIGSPKTGLPDSLSTVDGLCWRAMAKKLAYSVKGTHAITSQQWADERLGEGTFVTLGRQLGIGWSEKLLPSSWYDVFGLMKIMEKVCEKSGSTIFDAYKEIAHHNASNDLTTIYRAFLRLAGPKGLLNATPTLWSLYVSFGNTEKIKNEPGLHIAVCRGIPSTVLDWACGAWTGFVPTAAEVAGGKNAKLVITERGVDESAGEPGFSFLRAEVTYDT